MPALIRYGIVPLLALAAYWAGLRAWADHLSRSNRLTDREWAVSMLQDPSLYERLADKIEETGGDPLPALERAAALEPADASRRMRLGLRAEMAGRFDVAERNLLAAARLSRQYQPRYLLAQYYFRRQDARRFFPWARTALDRAYGEISPLLDLCWRMRPDAEWLSAHALPARTEVFRQYLVFLSGRQLDAAGALAPRLADSAGAADVPALLGFCDHSLAAGHATRPLEVWNRLCLRGLLPFEKLDPENGDAVTDGQFLRRAVGQGFDWRLNDTDGVKARRLPGELRVAFSGRQAEWCGIAWQYLAAQPARRYRLTWQARGVDGTELVGVCWKIYDLAGTRVAAEIGGGRILTFVAPAEVLVLMLSYERPMGSPRLSGTVAVTRVSLEPAP